MQVDLQQRQLSLEGYLHLKQKSKTKRRYLKLRNGMLDIFTEKPSNSKCELRQLQNSVYLSGYTVKNIGELQLKLKCKNTQTEYELKATEQKIIDDWIDKIANHIA